MKDKGVEHKPSSYACEFALKFSHYTSVETIRQNLTDIFSDVTGILKSRGCKLIGHIKALLDAGADGKLFFSTTEFDRKAKCKGNIEDKIISAKLGLNIIVFGVEVIDIENVVNEHLSKLENLDEN
jgi:hypothetical protein